MNQQTDDRVRSLLNAAAAPSEAGPLPGEPEALAAFRATVPSRSGRIWMRTHLTPAKTVAAAALGAGLILTGGVSAAAVGALPDSAQGAAHAVLNTVGVTVPDAPDANSGKAGQPNHGSDVSSVAKPDPSTGPGPDHGALVSEVAKGDHGKPGDDTATTPGDTPKTQTSNHGADVSNLAKTTDPGPSHGPTVSAIASGGRARAGGQGASGDTTHGQSGDTTHGTPGDAHPSSTSGEAGSSSDDATEGQATADQARGDHGSQGSEHRH